MWTNETMISLFFQQDGIIKEKSEFSKSIKSSFFLQIETFKRFLPVSVPIHLRASPIEIGIFPFQ